MPHICALILLNYEWPVHEICKLCKGAQLRAETTQIQNIIFHTWDIHNTRAHIWDNWTFIILEHISVVSHTHKFYKCVKKKKGQNLQPTKPAAARPSLPDTTGRARATTVAGPLTVPVPGKGSSLEEDTCNMRRRIHVKTNVYATTVAGPLTVPVPGKSSSLCMYVYVISADIMHVR